MEKLKIHSPMASGNGACVLHKLLESRIPGYTVRAYSPYLTLFPPALCWIGACRSGRIVHTTPDYAPFFIRGKSPLVITFHNYVLDAAMQPYSSLFQRWHYRTDLRWWTTLAVRQASAITAVSHYIAELVKKEMRIERPIRVIHNGVDTNRFRPGRQEKKGDGTIRVFFSGNLTRRKGAHWLLPIASRLPPSIQICYTQGLRTRTRLPQQDHLIALGAVPYDRMAARYQEMDILLMPTVREGFGLAVVEAMACGLPIVASDCSAIPELVDEGKGGFLCPVGDVGAFAEKIQILAESPALRKQMGQYNRTKVEKYFTLDRMVQAYRMLFLNL